VQILREDADGSAEDNARPLPPLLLLHGRDDTTVPLSSSQKFLDGWQRRLIGAAGAASINSRLQVIAGGGHSTELVRVMRGEESELAGALREILA
jgi:pimeloyl-ACP methyl ester carboxylesterase